MNNTIEEIHVRTTIEDYKTIFNLQDDPANKENHFVCPLCGSGSHRGTHSTAGFNIYLENGKYKWHCYACKNSGDIIGLYEQVKGVSTGEAIKSLAEYFGTQEERQQIQPQNKSEQYFYPPFTDRYGEVLIYRKDRFYIEGELDAEGKIKKHFAWHTFKNGIEISVIDEKGKKKIGQFNSKAEKEADLPLLYLSGTPTEDKIVYICEGEKDCENLAKQGKYAVSTAYGYGKGVKWEKSFSEILKANGIKLALVLVDNDESGRAGSFAVAKRLTEDGIQSKLIDISKKWNTCPKKSDISNAMEFFDIDKAMQMLTELIEETPVFNVDQTQTSQEIENTHTQPKKLKLDTFSIKDLSEMEFTPIKWTVKNLIPQGLTVLAAPPKYGKSWMCFDLCNSVATGEPFLGFETVKGTSLYLALEDSKNRLQTRIEKVLQGKTRPDNFRIAIQSNSIDTGLIDDLQEFVDNFKDTNLIIIDTFQKIRGKANRSETLYASDYREMSILKTFADSNKIALILIHHLKKSEDVSDPFNRISGTNGIFGSTDAAIVLSRAKRTDDNTVMYATGRDVEQSETILNFNKETCRWELLGSSEDIAYRQSPIVKFLKTKKGFNGRITDLLQECNEQLNEDITPTMFGNKIKEFAPRLEKEGFLIKKKRNYKTNCIDITIY